MSGIGFLSLICWLDDDGRHVWQQHDCNGQRVQSMLPTTWRAGDVSEPTHNSPRDVTPSIHCLTCGLHAFGTIVDEPPPFQFHSFGYAHIADPSGQDGIDE